MQNLQMLQTIMLSSKRPFFMTNMNNYPVCLKKENQVKTKSSKPNFFFYALKNELVLRGKMVLHKLTSVYICNNVSS